MAAAAEEAPPPDAAGEALLEPDAPAPATVPSPGAAQAAEPRPLPGASPPPLDLALQSAAGHGWRLAANALRAAPEPSPAPAARDVAGQITLAIAEASSPQIEIRLDPPELGRVQIRLTPVDGGLAAMILADRPETQDFLRRHADTLMRELGDAGYAQVSLEFAAGGDAPPRDAPDRRFAGFDAAATLATAAEAPVRGALGGLDIRL